MIRKRSQKLKIAFICSRIDNMAGGIERQILRTCDYLLKENYDVTLITYDNYDAKPFYQLPDNLCWFKCGNGLRIKGKLNFLKRFHQILNLRRLIKKNKFTHLITFHHGLLPRSIFASIFLNVIQIVSERNSLSHYQYIKLNKFNIGFLSMIFADKITIQLKDYKNMYPKILQKKIIIIPNFIEKPLKENLYPEFNSNIISMVGRLSYQKNHELLLSRLNSKKEIPNLKIKIAGEGELRNYFEKKYQKFIENSSLELCGNVKNIDNFLRGSSVFCFPSLWEGYPNSLIEALRVGMPIVTTKRMENLTEFVEDNINGLVVDDVDFYKSTLNLLSNKKLLFKMSIESKKKYLKLSEASPLKKWKNLMNNYYEG